MVERIDPQNWKCEIPAFQEKTHGFYSGEVDKNAYKGFSGLYGSYAQKGGKASMLRLRMTGGRLTKEKMAFVADVIRREQVQRAHFTTCETIQLHDLNGEQAARIMEEALDVGIVTMGGGGDFPRNVMCAPLSGVEADEYFDVMPYAEAAGEYLMHFIKAEKMPRKLKVCFSNSLKNVPHATYRDLGFAARQDGTFDVYSAGGLGNNPRFGVKVAEAVPPEKICYYIKAMWLTFRAYGNYENRGKARTRYMQDVCGGPEGYAKAYHEKLEEVLASGEDLDISVSVPAVHKKGMITNACSSRIIPQKQEGLYALAWHPIGGMPDLKVFCAVSDAIADMEAVEGRIAPDETVYFINLNGEEAEKLAALTAADSANSLFETSVSCIGAATCQVGVRDSQGLLSHCIQAVREAGLPDGALPQIHISGCPSSCGTHQTGVLGFRGGSKVVDGKALPAFNLFVGGCETQGCEVMGTDVGAILEDRIPGFLVELGKTVCDAGMDFAGWFAANPNGVADLAKQYLA